MSKSPSEFAKYSIAIALTLLVGCGQRDYGGGSLFNPQAVEPPRPVQAEGPVADSYFQLTIDYEYKKVTYHEGWIGHCFLYPDSQAGFKAKARWRGYAARLPDGSAVFFQPRTEICAKDQLRRLVFGPDATDTLWEGRMLYPIGPSETKIENDFGDAEPTTFTTPAVYWLDSPTQPVHVELCGVPACALAATARVRILGVHASPTQNTVVSNPLQAIPALAQLRSGDSRHIGYACWKIPLTELNAIMGLSSSQIYVQGQVDSIQARYILEILNSSRYKTMNAWSSAWDEDHTFYQEYNPINDVDFASPIVGGLVSIPISKWRRVCRLAGSQLVFDDHLAPPDLPIDVNLMSLESAGLIKISVPNDNDTVTSHLDASHISYDPDHYLVSTTSSDGSLYIGEPVEFAFDFSHGEVP
jgi:hypothetical protein